MIDLNAIQLDDQSMAADAMLRIIQDIVAPLLDDAGYEVTITKRHTLSKDGKNEATEGRERGQILIDVKPRPGLQAEGERT